MSTKPIPPREEIEAEFPRDVFEGAVAAFDSVFWLNLPEERLDRLAQQAGDVEEQLEELVLIWNRLGDDRLEQIDALRDRDAALAKIEDKGGGVKSGEYPEVDEAHARGRAAETALWLDYKSLFVFADILLGGYVRVSEFVWDAPAAIQHGDGISRFLGSVRRARSQDPLPDPFGTYMDALFGPLVAIDDVIGFYRDKFITHVPADMFMTGAGWALDVPLEFHLDYGHRREVAEAEIRIFKEALDGVEQAEGFRFGGDELDPRARLRKVSKLLGKLRNEESVKMVKGLLKEWGMTSPPVIEVATALNNVLELWAKTLIATVGLIDPEEAVSDEPS